MIAKKVPGTFHNGVIHPAETLDLKEGERVEIIIHVLPQTAQDEKPHQPLVSLEGQFPELVALTDKDFKAAKQVWEKGARKQATLLDNA